MYLIDYNNDVHNPASRANQKDIAMRMQQFFDNKLMGAPAPDWMVHGIPYVAKGKDQLAPAPVQAGKVTPEKQQARNGCHVLALTDSAGSVDSRFAWRCRSCCSCASNHSAPRT